MNATRRTMQLALSLFIAVTGMFVSCVKDEQAPFSGGEDSEFYVQLPGYKSFIIGSEVVLKGNKLSEISKVYVEKANTEGSGESPSANRNRIEARITSKTNNELVFVLPAGTAMGEPMIYYEREGETHPLNVLPVGEPWVSLYEDERVIVFRGEAPLADDKIYFQCLKQDEDTGQMAPVTGEWIESSFTYSETYGWTVEMVCLGATYVRLVHRGEDFLLSGVVNIEPRYCIRFPQTDWYHQGDEVTLTGGLFEEGDVIAVNGVPAEIVSIDTANDALTFRIPESVLGYQSVSLWRYGVEYSLAEILVYVR